MDARKTITIEQYRSAARRPEIQTATLKGLKLNKIRRRATLVDTPAVRGMIARIPHLVRIVETPVDPKAPVKHKSLHAATKAIHRANKPGVKPQAKKAATKK